MERALDRAIPGLGKVASRTPMSVLPPLGTEAVLAGKKARAFPLRFVARRVFGALERRGRSAAILKALSWCWRTILRDYRWILRYASWVAVTSCSQERDGLGSFSRECQRPDVGLAFRRPYISRGPDAGEDG